MCEALSTMHCGAYTFCGSRIRLIAW